MTGPKDGSEPLRGGRTPQPRAGRGGPRLSHEDDAELARREAREFLEQTGRGIAPSAARGAPKERRREKRIALIERRKGQAWLVGQVVLLAVLLGYLGCSLAR